MNRILLNADASDGGDPSPNAAPAANVVTVNTSPPLAATPASGNRPVAQLPQAAETVLTGDHTEIEVELRSQIELEKKSHATTAQEKKDRELRIAELEDELQRLRAVPAQQKEEKWRYRPFKSYD